MVADFATRHPVLARIMLYGVTRGTVEALLGVRGIILATVLGPEGFGGWALFRLAGRYAGLAALGVGRGLEYEVVRARSSGQAGGDAEAHEFERAALGFVVVVFGVMAVIALAASAVVADARLQAGLRAFALGVLAEQLWQLLAIAWRARGSLRKFAVNELVNAALHLIFAWLLATAFGLNGAYVGFVFASAISATLVLRAHGIAPRWSSARVVQLLRTGMPMLALVAAGLVLSTVDRWVVAAYGGAEQLGLYAFAVAVATLANTAALVIRTVIFPSVYAGAADQGTGHAIERHTTRALRPFAFLLPPLLGLAAIAMGPVIAAFLPQYTEAIPAARIFIFTGVATGLVSLTTIAVVAAQRQRLLPACAAVGIALNVGLSSAALSAGLGLAGVAGAALLGQSLYAVAVLTVMGYAGGVSAPLLRAVGLLMPALWCVASLLVIQRFVPMLTPSSALIGAGLFALLMLPWARRATYASRHDQRLNPRR